MSEVHGCFLGVIARHSIGAMEAYLMPRLLGIGVGLSDRISLKRLPTTAISI